MIPIVLTQSVLFFITGGIFDNTLFKIEMIYSILMSFITSLFYLSLGILFGCLCNEKAIGGISSITISAQSLLSGMWFPIEGLDRTLIAIMNALPFKNATMLMQNTLNGINDIYQDLLIPLCIVLAYTIVTFILSIIVFKKKMKAN